MENTSTDQREDPEFANLDPAKTTQFEADGTVWHIDRSNKLSIARKRWLERFETYTLYGRDGNSILAENRKAYDFINQGKPADAAVTLNNILSAVHDLTQKDSPVLYLCTLFINEPGEDKGAYDLNLAKQKIDAWERARPVIPSDFFLALAFAYLRLSRETWSAIIQTYSGLLPDNPVLTES